MCFPQPGLHYLRPGRLQADSWTHFSRVQGRELDRLGAHMRGLHPGQPSNGFRMEEETNFSNLKHRFSCQEILDSKKKKNYNHKEKGFAVCTKGPSCVKSDSEMEPESRDNGAGRKRRGEEPGHLSQAPEGQRGIPCLKEQLRRAMPSVPPPTATPSLCAPPPLCRWERPRS